MTSISQTAGAVALILLFTAGIAHTDGAGDPKAVSSREGEYLDKDGKPTFKVANDGTVDWYSYVGYLRYGANCFQCHGPDERPTSLWQSGHRARFWRPWQGIRRRSRGRGLYRPRRAIRFY